MCAFVYDDDADVLMKNPENSRDMKDSDALFRDVVFPLCPGAIHINTPFDEPLIEDIDNIQKIYIKKINSKLNYKYSPDLRNTSIENSLIICGEINANESLDQILDFSEYVDAPILVDPTSNLRFYKKHKNIISNYNFIIDKIKNFYVKN